MSKANQKKTSGKALPAVLLTLVIVVVVAISVFSILDNFGVVKRISVAAKSNNFTVTDAELAVYEFQAAQVYSQQAQTEYYYYQAGLYEDTNGITKTYSTASEYAADVLNYYRQQGVLKEQAYHFAEEYLIFCEGAKADAGFTNNDTTAQVDEYVQSIKDTAAAAEVSFSYYVSYEIGKGINESDIRSALDKYFLYANFSEYLTKKYADGLTDEDLTKYRDEHKSDFFTAEYTSYTPVVDYISDEAAKACKDANAIKLLICDSTVDTKFTDMYKTYVTDKDIDLPEDKTEATFKADVINAVKQLAGLSYSEHPFTDKNVTDKKDDAFADYYAAGRDIAKSLYDSSIKGLLANVKADTSAAYVDISNEENKPTDLQKWLFAGDRKVGDTWIESKETTKESGEKETTRTLYVVTTVNKLDTAHKRNVGYVLFSDEKDAAGTVTKTGAEKAAAMKEALKGIELNEENFEKLALEHNPAASQVFYNMGSTDTPEVVRTWLYSEDRKEGDTDVLESSTDRYVVYYVNEIEDENWEAQARSSRANELVTEWVEKNKPDFGIVSDHVHEEGTEATSETVDEHAGHDHD